MKHNHRRISRESLRIAFQLPTPYLEKPFKVWRIRAEQDSHSFHLEGLVLAGACNVSPAVVAHVLAGDVVMITHHPEDGLALPHRGFLISDSIEPIPLEDLSPYFCNHTTTNGPVIDFDGTRFLHFRENDLKEFMRSKHPQWLQEHVDATLRLWRTESPDLFARIAPPHWLTRKPWLLAMYDPKRALAEFPHLIKGNLGRYCIRRILAPVSRSVATALPLKLKPFQRFKNTEFLLEHLVNDLTDDQLRTCARTSPSAALRLITRMVDPRHRAIVLSCAFRPAWHERTLLRNPEFRNTVLESLTEHFEEWMISNPDGLQAILGTIADRLQLPPTECEFVRMLDQLGPVGRQAVADYIAARL